MKFPEVPAEVPNEVQTEVPKDPLTLLLGRLLHEFHREDLLRSDPLEFVHRYKNPWDQEAVALIAATLAYGNVKQIRRSVEAALERMARVSEAPNQFVRGLAEPGFQKIAKRAFRGYVHRFNVGGDLVVLLSLLSRSWREQGSLGAHFLSNHRIEAPDFTAALNALIATWRGWLSEAGNPRVNSSFHYLLTAPMDGSACKRWCMFLRWMGRKDALDPGLWSETGALRSAEAYLRADQLVLPLDTHTGRISQYLGLTERKSLNWKAALEVTARLRKIDPADPTRYDFALSRLGILEYCKRKYRPEICEKCELLPACRFAQEKAS
jgi:uncharacterized protein (TIGR02757 family)